MVRILNAIFKPSTDLKRMVEILSNIEQNVRLTVFQDYMVFETMNPVHGVSTSLFMSGALFQTYNFDANYSHWSALINADEFSKLLDSVNDDDQKVEISVEVDQQHARMFFFFYDMDDVVRLRRMMGCQPIEGVNYSETYNLIVSMIEAHGFKIKIKCTREFMNALERSSTANKPVVFRITNDLIEVSIDNEPAVWSLNKGTNYSTNNVPHKFSRVQVSLYEAKYIIDTASLGELCVLKVITNEASSLALPLLLEFVIKRDHIFVFFTLPSNSVVRPLLLA